MNKKSQASAIVIFAILCLCYMVPNYAQYQVSPLGSQVIAQYDLQLAQLSSLFSAPMIPAIFLSLAGGLLLDKLGTKPVIAVSLLVTAVGCIGRIFCASYMPLFLCTMLTGLSACFINAGSGKIVGSLFPADQVSGKMGILMAASTAAMTIANFTSAYFPSIRSAFTVSAGFSVIMFILWVLFVPVEKSVECRSDEPSLSKCLGVALRNTNVWLISLAMFFIMAANVIISSYLPTALGENGMSATTAGYIAACYTIGNFAGCLIAPVIIAKLRSQKKTLILFGILGAIGAAFAWMIPLTILLAAGMLMTGICFGGMIPVLLALPVQLPEIGPTYAGTAGGIIGTIQLLGAVLLPSYVLTPIAGDNFHLLFILGGVCMLAAGALTAGLRRIQ